MGVIEGGLIAAGLSATTASAVSAGIIAAGVGAVANAALAPKPPKAANVTPLNQAERPQEAKAVDRNALLQKNALAASAGGALAGNGSTLLTGSGGVSSNSLNLGTSTLLGQ